MILVGKQTATLPHTLASYEPNHSQWRKKETMCYWSTLLRRHGSDEIPPHYIHNSCRTDELATPLSCSRPGLSQSWGFQKQWPSCARQAALAVVVTRRCTSSRVSDSGDCFNRQTRNGVCFKNRSWFKSSRWQLLNWSSNRLTHLLFSRYDNIL